MQCHSTKLKAYLLTIADHELVQYFQILAKTIVSLQSRFLLAEIPYIYCAVCLNIEEGPHSIFFFFTGRSNAFEGGRQSCGYAGVPLEHVSTR